MIDQEDRLELKEKANREEEEKVILVGNPNGPSPHVWGILLSSFSVLNSKLTLKISSKQIVDFIRLGASVEIIHPLLWASLAHT